MRNTNRATSLIVLLLTVLPVATGCNANTDGASGMQRESRNRRDAGIINPIRDLSSQRATHTAALLPDGRVLVAGGFASDG